ncbi:putative hemolysin E-like protein [Pseudolycoriella hygida]|uniref:Hemolysin E-like protein n=1 Tax=Pseudolycoriella hygida TaxID=35572 RepID=A0A9Q0MIA6_9DIPT|nr:putative hemolysin E-like protein [Pseudolycoriella hygida]
MNPRGDPVCEVIEITNEGIETISKALDLYNKVLDQIVPWKTYEKTVKELDRFRSDYSKLVGSLLVKMPKQLLQRNSVHL